MLKELFESSFYVIFPARKGMTVNLTETIYSNNFQLHDKKACRDCHNVCADEDIQRVQLYVETTTAVSCLSIDQLIGYIDTPVGKNCDYLCDDSKVSALIEMTCSNTEWVNSKRQTAREQLYNTLCLFYANPAVKSHFEKEPKKYAIFSWKDTTIKDDEDDAPLASMMGMTTMSDAVYSVDNESDFDYGFKLKEIRYPEPLVWNKL